jgi:hypothetical protein
MKVNDLKVGDLAYLGIEHNRLGVITKFVRVGSPEGYPGVTHYYATVFVFKSADSLTVSTDRLTKAEVEGV